MRTLATPCPECNASAPKGEVNRSVVERREGLALVAAAITKMSRLKDDSLPEPKPGDLTKYLTSLLKAISAFAGAPKSTAAIDALARAVVQFQSSREVLQAQSGRRPGIGMRLALLESTRQLLHIWELYRIALSAATMSEAQSSAKEAQEVMDSAANPVVQAADLRDVAEAFGDESMPVAERMFAALKTRYPDISVANLREQGVVIAQNDLGLAVGPNSGLSFLLLEPIAATILDPIKFRAKIRLAAAGASDIVRIKSVAAMNGAVGALADTHRLMVEACAAYSAVLNVETDERSIARRTGKLVNEIYEAASPILAWYRLLTGVQESPEAFERVASEDATKLASDLQNGPLAAVFDDAAKYLRHAPVHGRALDYEPESGQFVISLKSHSEVIPRQVFLDRILAFIETVLASIWSLENSIELAGIEMNLSNADALYLGFTPLVLTAISLPAAGGIVVLDYGKVDEEWFFRVESDSDLLIPALTAATNAVGFADRVVVTATDEPPLTVRLADSQAWLRAVGHEMTTNFIAFKATAERSGSSILERTDIQFTLAGLGGAMLGGDIHTIPHLRRLRYWSKERGWVEEVKLAEEIMAVPRGSAPPDLGHRLAELISRLPIPRMPAARAVRVILPHPQPKDRSLTA